MKNLRLLLLHRLHWINLPGAMLLALLQRTPLVNAVAAGDEMVIASPVGTVLKALGAIAASLGAMNSLAGATPLVPSAGTASGISATTGTAVSVFYTVNGTLTPPASWRVEGSVPPGLDFSGLTGAGTVTVGALHLEGTPTTAGTFNLTLQAFEFAGGAGIGSPVYAYTITVTGGGGGGGGGATAPAITTQPASQSVTVGAAVTFSAAASGSPAPTFQWRKDGADIAGARSGSFMIASAAAADAGTYTAVATNSAGSATSAGAVLTVTAAATAPAFTTQPASQTVTVGAAVTFTAAASGSPAPTYQWRKDGVDIAGATTGSFMIASVAATDAGTYTAVAANSAGAATSTGAVLTVQPAAGPAAPAITAQPQPMTAAAGQAASFAVTATGTPAPTFAWQREPAGSATWEPLAEGGSYHGVATATLVVNAVAAAMSGDQFRVTLANASGAVTSSAAALTVTGGAVALLQYPVAVAEDAAGNLYVADAGSDTIARIAPDGTTRTLAGSPGVAGSADGFGGAARFNQPGGIAIDGSGNLYVTDTGNATIRKVATDGTVTTLAGSAASRGSADGTGAAASFNQPGGIAIDAVGNLYVADAMNDTIRKITPAGVVTTIAGTAGSRGDADGTGAAALFNFPGGVAVDAAGNVYVADTFNDTIRRITPAGVVTTLAGSAGISGSNDGTGANALFNQPDGVAVDSAGNVLVADTANAVIREVTAAGAVTTIAGTAGVAGMGNGAGASALFNQPRGLEVDGAGNSFVADTGNGALRKLASDGTVSTLALVPPSSGNSGGGGGSTSGGGNTPPPSMGGGGGGGALSAWFELALAVLAAARWADRRRRLQPAYARLRA